MGSIAGHHPALLPSSSPSTHRAQHNHCCDEANDQCDNQLDHHKGLDVNPLVWEEHLAIGHGNRPKHLQVNVASSHLLQDTAKLC